MKQTTLPIKNGAKVVVSCSEDLSIEGHEEASLMVIVEQGDFLKMWEGGRDVRISASSDCRIFLPSSTQVTVEKVGGDCYVSNLSENVVLGRIGRDLRMRSIQGALVESSGGNCYIQEASDAIEIARVGGSLSTDKTQSLLVGSVGDRVCLCEISGKVDVRTGADAKIQVSQAPVKEIRVTAGSDIELFLPPDAQCSLNLQSGASEIFVHAAGQHVESREQRVTLPLGSGGASVSLKTGGQIRVTDQGLPQWSGEIFDWGEHWKDFGFRVARRVGEGIRIAGDSMEKAVRHAGMASRSAEKHIRQAMRGWEDWRFMPGHHVRYYDHDTMEEVKEEKKAAQFHSDEERILVLKMLHEKKISVEEAEKLLNALE